VIDLGLEVCFEHLEASLAQIVVCTLRIHALSWCI
jgi:hypothetical protein